MNGIIKLYLEASLKEDKKHCPAGLYTMLGMKKEALDCLEKLCRKGIGDVPRIIRYPEFENLHSSSRFQTLVDTMNLRPYFSEPSR